MRIVRTPAALIEGAGGAFVPTMGALHEGHLALMRRARSLAAPVVVSIFVNPTQFGPGEDFERYPRTLDPDLAAAREVGVDVVFVPAGNVIYPAGQDIPVPPLPEVATAPGLEDARRPGHFAGVCQVVARLLDLVRPSAAVFGEKDYQQLLVVREMVRREGDRWPGLRIVGHPTVREPDGLALSSRNAYLQPRQRQRGLGLIRALDLARRAAAAIAPSAVQEAMRAVLAAHELDVEYAVVRHAETLEPLASLDSPARALIAARVGTVRLIDNVAVGEERD
ncbi:MAG: pantoate--beta-alanine ligase [Planctomycetota bacterium]|jgi:pantoate--beta-alanine ligase